MRKCEKCTKCQKQVPKRVIINPDGYNPMCPACQAIPEREYKFCPKCGQKLNWGTTK